MKFKNKFMIIALIICLFFMISSVSAVDSEADAIGAQNLTDDVMSAEINDNLEMNDVNEVLAETDEGTHTNLSNKISTAGSGATIFLENDYKFSDSDFGQIIISSPLTINGQGHTIDANGKSSIFQLNSNNIILKNIIFANGYNTDGGGAIYTETNDAINIVNCTFINNQASYGGAIYSHAYYNMGVISETTFIQNKATNYGGNAIYNYADAVTINKCIFMENNGNQNVIFGYGQTVKNSIFINHNVPIFGGSKTSLENNWFGNTVENMETEPNLGSEIISNVKYYVLKIIPDKTGSATISLNNLYENGVLTSVSNCALPSIKFDVSAVNITVPNNVVLGNDGTATITYTPVDEYSITVKYNGVELTKFVKPNTFSSLKDEIINGGTEIKLDQDYEYDATKDAGLTNGIDFAKDVTIDGDGHIIDAKGLSNIFNFDDTTSSKNLILKNIVFKNAVGENGAVINFKGNKLQVISCSFLDNIATNSLINIDTNEESSISDSIFSANTATYNVVSTGNVVANHNWWGNTLNNYENNIAKTSGVSINNWLYLNITAVTGITGTATVSLNNVYDGSTTSKYNDYVLPTIRVNLGGTNAQPKVSFIDIDQTGQATYQFDMSKKTATLTADYNVVTASKGVEYVIVDDGSFKALNEIIHFSNENDVIELTHDYVYSATDTIKAGISISKKLTINGNGHKIDAKGKSRIFDIFVSDIEINNVSIINGKSKSGSAIYLEYHSDNCKFLNCNFTDNQADYGGAIYAVGDYCTIENCSFIHNTASDNDYGGGAILYYHDNEAYIKNCSFEKNNAASDGGAISGIRESGKLFIVDSDFENNSAEFGGAINCWFKCPDLNIENSNFTNNNATSTGGAINSYALKGAFDKCIFINNSANTYSALNSVYGGSISNSIFLNNTGNFISYTDFIKNWFGDTVDNPSQDLSNFASNWYYLDIDAFEDYAIISLKLYNKSTEQISIDKNYNLPDFTIYLKPDNLTLSENVIKLNESGQYKVSYALNNVKGSITAQCENAIVTKQLGSTDFEKLQKLINDADENDVIELTQNYIYNLEFDTITNGIVINKKNLTIIGNGYTIDAKEKTRIFNVESTASDLTLKNITFSNSKHSGNGGSINWRASNGNLINCTFINSTSSSNGGAVYFASNTGKIINCTFEKASAGKGGFIYIAGSNSNVINSTFVNGYASTNGGSIYISGTSAEIFNCTFDTNHAGWGGVIETNKEKSTIANCTFKNNWATSDTRIINGYGASLTISNCTFSENGKGSNNVLIFVSTSNFKLINSTFVDNNAGAIQVSGTNAKVDKSLFIRNKGVVCKITGTGGNVSNSIFLNNNANCFSGSLTADYNWFGNRIDTNGINTYKNTPSNLGITVNNWLYINATYNPVMLVDSSQPIKVEFKVYANGVISDYDASKVHEVNLKLSCENGTLDKHVAVVGETFSYTANKVGTDKITVDVFNNFKVFNEYLNLNVKINKIPTELTLDETSNTTRAHVTIDMEKIVKHITPEGVHGIYQYSTDNSEILEIVNGYLLSGNKAGTANLIIEFIPDNTDKYETSTATIEYTIIKNNEGAIIADDTIVMKYGDEAEQIEVDLTPTILHNYYIYDYVSLVYTSNDTDVVTVTQDGVITPVNAGVANITIRFEETEDWEAFEKNVTVTVNKIDSSITFSNDIVFDYLESNTTTLTLTGCGVDLTNISVIDHPDAVIDYNAETKVITLSGLDAGTYTLNVTTTPDRNHNSVWNTTAVTVNKIDSSMSLSNTNIEFDYSASNSTTLTFVGCSVDIENISVIDADNNIVDNAFVYEGNLITISGLDAGTYTLKVIPTINRNYNPTESVEVPIKVNKIDSSFEISNSIEFNYLESNTTNIVNLDGCTVDLENISVLNSENNIISNVVALDGNVITVSGLAAGEYTLKVTTTPDKNHKSVEKTTTVTVDKILSTISLSNNNLIFDFAKSNTTTLTLNGCTVDLTNINVLDSENNPVDADIAIENNIITVAGLDAGTYTLKVATTPDENHTSVDTTADIAVNKVNSSVKFSNPVNLFFSETGSTTLILDGCSVVLADISVFDHTEAGISLENNVITISDLAEGSYTLKVVTTPDKNHFSVENTTSVKVYKVGPKMEMDYSNITVGEAEKVYVNFNTDAVGTVNVTVSQGSSIIRTENISMTNGFNKTVFTGLKVGTYNISAHYYGQGRYNDSTVVYKLIVHPIYEFEFSAEVNDTVMGNKTNATVTLAEGVTGKIVVGDVEKQVDGTKTIIELPIQNTLGKNNVTVRYVPDENSKYASRELTVLYDVAKVESEITLEIVNKTTNDPVTITANIDAEGNVTFIVNGKKYSRVISDKKAVLELDSVAGGKYNVTAVYDGNGKYANSSANDTFIVEKLNSTISITVSPGTIKADGEATVTVSVEGEGTVTIIVNGVPTNVTANEGVAALTVKNIVKGPATISAKYFGDDKYNGNETDEIPLTVEGVTDYEITLDVADITVGEDAIAYITVPADAVGNVNITVSQANNVIRPQKIAEYKNIISDLTVGSYNITAKYLGDDKYDVKEITKEFAVKPLNVAKLDFVVKINDTVIGETANMTVTLPDDATGIIKIGDTEYVIGKNTLPVQTKAGLNNVTVKYIADESSNYSDDEITVYYNVFKKSAEITIVPVVAKAGETVNIQATAYDGAVIKVFVDGTETKKVTDISAGKHTVIATVEETDKYLKATANYTFEVSKLDSLIKDIKVNPVTEGAVTIVEVTMNSTESGNVIIEIDGLNYTASINQSKASVKLSLNKTSSGKVYYLGDDKFNKADVKEFTAIVNPKAYSIIEIITPELNIGELATVTATVNGNPVEIYINGVKGNTIDKVEAVTYTVTAVFEGNATHSANTTSKSFTVTKKDVTLKVTGTNAKVGEKSTVTVEITDDATGIVVVNVNGTEYSLDISKTKTLEVVMPNKGTATLSAKYQGDDKYNEKTSDASAIEVTEKSKPEISLNIPDDIKIGDSVTVPVSDGWDVYIDNVKQSPVNGKVTLPTTVGPHTVVAVANETPDSQYAFEAKSYEVSKKDSEISITSSQARIGQTMTIVIDSGDRNDAKVSIDGVKYDVGADGSVQYKATFGKHTVVAVLDETDEYLSASANYTFDVDKKQSVISIKAPETAVEGSEVTITFDITSQTTGTVLINVNGTKYSKTLPNKSLKVVLDKAGTYNIEATYLGDDIFNSSDSDVKTIKVSSKKVTSIDVVITPSNPKIDEPIEVKVTCESPVKVLFDGKEVSLINGKYMISNPKSGNHIVEVISSETATNKANSTAMTVKVDKKQSSISIDNIAGDLMVDSFNRVNLNYVGNEVIVYLDGVRLDNYNQFKADAGTHTISANVVEDDEYMYSSANCTFTINKKSLNVNIDDGYVNLGDEYTVNVDIPNDATGMVIIDVNGTEYMVDIGKTHKLSVVLTNHGDYPIFAKYLGDDRYGDCISEIRNIHVEDKKNSEISYGIISDVFNVGDEIILHVSSDNVYLTVSVDGNVQEIIDNQVTIEGLDAGVHTIEIVAQETETYKANSTIIPIEIVKKQTDISIIVPDSIKAGDNVNVQISAYPGAEINVYLDGVKQKLTDGVAGILKASADENKVVNFKATAGTHTITASVGETGEYLAAFVNKTFTVSKLDAHMTVEATDIVTGQETTITVNTDVSEGIVNVKVGNKNVAVDLSQSKTAKVKLNSPGSYIVSAEYLGSDRFNALMLDSSYIKVDKKAETEMDITIPNIKAGQDGTVEISAPGATGDVHIIVDGKDTVLPLDKDGKAKYDLENLSAGNHSIVVVYPGDETHDSIVVTRTVTADKQTSTAKVYTPRNVNEGESGNVTVEIPDATGQVSVIVDGKEQKVDLIDGKANITLNSMAGGDHNIVVVYPGDDTHSPVYRATSFTVKAKEAKKATEFIDVKVESDFTISAKLVDIEGRTIGVQEIQYSYGSVSATVKTGGTGRFTIKGENNVEIKLVFRGNDEYLGTNTSITVNQPKADERLSTMFNVSSGYTFEVYAVDYYAGERGYLFNVLLTDSNKNPIADQLVQFGIQGRVHNKTSNSNGVATLQINLMSSNEYTCTPCYLGNTSYDATFSAAKIIVKKKPITIVAKAKTFKATAKTKKYTVNLKTIVGSSADGKVYLKAGKKVTMKLNGKTYYAKTNAKGQATFNIKMTKKGKFSAVLKFAGDTTYASASKNVKITIK